MPRLLRRFAGAAVTACTLAAALTGATATAPSAAARGSHPHIYRVSVHVTRTAIVHVRAHATMRATATARVAVPGNPAVSATATAIAGATSTGAAKVTVRARRAGVATHRSVARHKAHIRAAAAAKHRAHVRAAAFAKRRAISKARTLARERALRSARAKAHARALGAVAKAAQAPTTPSSGPCGGAQLTKADGSAWTCSFDDEFDGTALDRSKWTVQTTAGSGFGNNQSCFFDDPSNVSVAGGVLRLTARRLSTPITCRSSLGAFTTQYTAGSVNGWNKFAQTYGRFEVRAKLPATTVAGLQETLWLWPVDQFSYGAWPLSGEIDFGEFYSLNAGWNIPYLHYGVQQSTVSWATNANVYTALPGTYAQPGMNCRINPSWFNTYSVLWEPGRLTISVNGQACVVNNYQAAGLASPAPFDKAFFLALTQGVGQRTNAPTAATPFPATTAVDYVRIWK